MTAPPTIAGTIGVPASNRLPSLVIRGRAVLPIVQGGMGVGISAHRLAGNVARLGGVGTIASVDLRRHHPDLMRDTQHCRDAATIDRANHRRGAEKAAMHAALRLPDAMRAARRQRAD